MFGMFRRGKAIDAATKACLDLVRLKELDGGIPPRFWRDPYVLGYFGGTIGTFAKLTSNNKLAGSDLGNVIADTLKNLTGARGDEVVRNYIDATKEMSDDFKSGMLNANKVIMIMYGSNQFQDDADVVMAKWASPSDAELDASLGINTTEQGRIALRLQQQYFFETVKQRLA